MFRIEKGFAEKVRLQDVLIYGKYYGKSVIVFILQPHIDFIMTKIDFIMTKIDFIMTKIDFFVITKLKLFLSCFITLDSTKNNRVWLKIRFMGFDQRGSEYLNNSYKFSLLLSAGIH